MHNKDAQKQLVQTSSKVSGHAEYLGMNWIRSTSIRISLNPQLFLSRFKNCRICQMHMDESCIWGEKIVDIWTLWKTLASKNNDSPGYARYTKSIYALLSCSIGWSLLCYCVRNRDHYCVLYDVARDLLLTWYIVHQPIPHESHKGKYKSRQNYTHRSIGIFIGSQAPSQLVTHNRFILLSAGLQGQLTLNWTQTTVRFSVILYKCCMQCCMRAH